MTRPAGAARPSSHTRLRVILAVLLSLAFLVAPASPATAQADIFRVTLTVNWYLGMQLGVEYRPVDHLGVAAGVGSTLFSFGGDFILTYDAAVVVYTLSPSSRLQVNALLGILNATTVFSEPFAGELPFGAAAQIGYGVSDQIELFFRVGEAVPFYWDATTFERDDVRFPLNLWPDLGMGVKFGF